MEKEKKVSKLELEILELEAKLTPDGFPSDDPSSGIGNGNGNTRCVDEWCIPRGEGAEC